jgi:hypothetical protein
MEVCNVLGDSFNITRRRLLPPIPSLIKPYCHPSKEGRLHILLTSFLKPSYDRLVSLIMHEKKTVFKDKLLLYKSLCAPDGLYLYRLGLLLEQTYTSTINTTKSRSEDGGEFPLICAQQPTT